MKLRIVLKKVSERRGQSTVDRFTTTFEAVPRAETAMSAAKEAQDTYLDPKQWPPIALLGLYLALLRDSSPYASRYQGSTLLTMYGRVRDLVSREGRDGAYHAIRVVWSPRFSWLNSDRLVFLLNQGHYEKHVIPALATRKPGEQAEWRPCYQAESFQPTFAEVKF